MAREKFGPDSTNPRFRRAFAHAQIAQLRAGEATFDDARTAVDAAKHTRKGKDSHFEAALSSAAVRAEGTTIFVHSVTGDADMAVYFSDRRKRELAAMDPTVEMPPPRPVDVFGYVIPKGEIEKWGYRYHASIVDKVHPPYEEIHTSGYPSVELKTTEPLRVQQGTGYDLAANPANAQLVHVGEPRPRRQIP